MMNTQSISEPPNTSVHIKVRRGDDVRRFSIDLRPKSFNVLQKRLFRSFFDGENKACMIKYKDDEGDLCSITNNDELSEALAGVGTTGGVLRLEIKDAEDKAPDQQPDEPIVENTQENTQDLDSQPYGGQRWTKARKYKRHDWSEEDKESWCLMKEEKAAFKEQNKGGWAAKRHGGRPHHGQRPHHGCRRGGAYRKNAKTFVARFVEDVTIPDGTVLTAGSSALKTWRLMNSGSDAWPIGTTFARVGGDLSTEAAPQSVPVPSVPAGATADISAMFQVPDDVGRFVTYWRLQDMEGNRFGQRFWCMFNVGAVDESVSVEPQELVEEADAIEAILAAGLTQEQAQVVMVSLRQRVHLGIACDVTGMSPLRGIRFTRSKGDDSYDVCEDAYQAMPIEERATLQALPRPDVAVLIKAVVPEEPVVVEEAVSGVEGQGPGVTVLEKQEVTETAQVARAMVPHALVDDVAAEVSDASACDATETTETAQEVLAEVLANVLLEPEPGCRESTMKFEQEIPTKEKACESELTPNSNCLTCPQGHAMAVNEVATNWCDMCKAVGTVQRCGDCDYDVCASCVESKLTRSRNESQAYFTQLQQSAREDAAKQAAAEEAAIAKKAAENEAALVAEQAAKEVALAAMGTSSDEDGFVDVQVPSAAMLQLMNMGFADDDETRNALVCNDNDLARAVTHLLR